eukprot:scaffold128871_cov32-Tisochrysis_lutea.AAC.3
MRAINRLSHTERVVATPVKVHFPREKEHALEARLSQWRCERNAIDRRPIPSITVLACIGFTGRARFGLGRQVARHAPLLAVKGRDGDIMS